METLFYLYNIPVVFATCLRIKSAEREEELYYYDIRHDDECQMTPCTLEPLVRVSHLGTIATSKPLPLTNGFLNLSEDDAANLLQVI